jgi:hypothetical protein
MSAAPLPVANSYAALSPDAPAGRVPRAKGRARPVAFAAAFDARTLFYDCFRHADGRRILLVGPPPYGIDYRSAAFTAGGETLRARYHASLSTMVTELLDAPADAATVRVTIAGETHELAVQPNSCAALTGRRLLFTVNRDNELGWIREWAEYHQRAHGTDAVIVVDNGSSRYDAAELRATLAAVPGIGDVAVPNWPYSFGPIDPAVTGNPYWARFLQIGSMSVVLRRYGEAAFGLLDCDIDELAGTLSGRSIYDLAHESRGGLVVFRGTWVEAVGEGTRHRDFTRRLADPKAALSRQRKWCLDPSRDWVRRLSVHPYWHWIEGRAWFSKSMPADATYWHFKGINTNWKHARTAAPEGPTVEDAQLAAAMRRAGLVGPEGGR